MDIQFENRNIMTQLQLRELNEFHYRPMVRKNLIAFGVMIATLILCTPILGGYHWAAVLLVSSISNIVQTLRSASKNADEAFESRLAYYDHVMPDTYFRFGERIVVVMKDVVQEIEYRKIKKVVSLEHAYVIVTTQPMNLLLSRNGFTKGTFEEFKQFLRQKRPDLKIPD